MQWSNCSTLLAVTSITAEDKGQVEFITSSVPTIHFPFKEEISQGSKNDTIVSRACQATCLAWHPFDATIAIGWADGHYNVNVLKGENAEGCKWPGLGYNGLVSSRHGASAPAGGPLPRRVVPQRQGALCRRRGGSFLLFSNSPPCQ